MKKSFANVIDHRSTLTFLMRAKQGLIVGVGVKVPQLDRKTDRPADRENEWRHAKANKRQQWEPEGGEKLMYYL